MARWFSWNHTAETQLKEFFATRMLLEHHLEGEGPPQYEDIGLCAIGKRLRKSEAVYVGGRNEIAISGVRPAV